MAYDKKKVYEEAIRVAKYEGVITIEELCAFLPCTREHFYYLFPTQSEQHKAIVAEINNFKVQTKLNIRKALGKSKRSSELIPLYRLVGTKEDRQKLDGKTDEDNTVKSPPKVQVEIKEGKYSKDED